MRRSRTRCPMSQRRQRHWRQPLWAPVPAAYAFFLLSRVVFDVCSLHQVADRLYEFSHRCMARLGANEYLAMVSGQPYVCAWRACVVFFSPDCVFAGALRCSK